MIRSKSCRACASVLVAAAALAVPHVARAQVPLTTLHSFAASAADGGSPEGELIQGTDGNFYGTTYQGGTFRFGTVLRMTADGAMTVLHAFAGGSADGAHPRAGLVEAGDGSFYGTTLGGGDSDMGTVFRMTPDGHLTVLHAFARGTADGASPITALVQAADGSFYGTALQGGRSTYGITFRFEAVSCVDRLTVRYDSGPPSEGGTLNLRFTLQSTVPATWSNWIFYAGGNSRWSAPIPAVSPVVFFNVPLRGFPAIGPVAVFTAISTPAQGAMCWDLKFVNPDAPSPTATQ